LTTINWQFAQAAAVTLEYCTKQANSCRLAKSCQGKGKREKGKGKREKKFTDYKQATTVIF